MCTFPIVKEAAMCHCSRRNGFVMWSRLILPHRSNDSLKMKCREVEKTECNIGFHLSGQYVTASLCRLMLRARERHYIAERAWYFTALAPTRTAFYYGVVFWATARCRLIYQLTVHRNPLRHFSGSIWWFVRYYPFISIHFSNINLKKNVHPS
jgi:hypothetical protein